MIDVRDQAISDWQTAKDDLLHARFWLAGGACLGGIAAFLFLWLAVPQYRAEAVLIPVMHGMVLQASSSEAAEESVPEEIFIEARSNRLIHISVMIQSPEIAKKLAEHDIFGPMVASWQRFDFDSGDSDGKMKRVRGYLQKHLQADLQRDDQVLRLVLTGPDPEAVVNVLQFLLARADEELKSAFEHDLKSYKERLLKVLEASRQAQEREILADMLMSVDRALTGVQAQSPYAARPLVPPALERTEAVWPQKRLVFPVFLFAGLFAGYLLCGVFHQTKRHEQSK